MRLKTTSNACCVHHTHRSETIPGRMNPKQFRPSLIADQQLIRGGVKELNPHNEMTVIITVSSPPELGTELATAWKEQRIQQSNAISILRYSIPEMLAFRR